MEWLDDNKIQIIPPKRPKKLTGTRFATILGLNPWSTPVSYTHLTLPTSDLV